MKAELKAEDERIEVYNNGWNDCKAEIIKMIKKDRKKYPWLWQNYCDFINDLLNKIDKI